MEIKNLLFNKLIFPRKNKKDPRIAEKQIEVKMRIQAAHEAGRYCFFENDFANEFLEKCEQENDYDRYMTFFDLIDGWDKVCNLSLESGEYVSNLWLADLNKIPAIYHTYLGGYKNVDGVPQSDELNEILKDGLPNYGHAVEGAIVGVPSLSVITSPLDSFTGMLNLVGSHKHSDTAIILQFPRELVTNTMDFANEEAIDTIYDISTGYYVIKPAYILGAIVKNEHGFDQFYSKEQLLSLDNVDKERTV